MVVRHCAFVMPDGRLCRAAPLVDGTFCYVHEPAKAEEAEEARRLGGLRRRREKTIVLAYELESLGTVEGILRVLDIASRDALGLENSIPRSRVLIGVAQAATRLLEVGELAARVAALEAALGQRHSEEETAFPAGALP
jgi:hypothetical protein